MSENMYRIRMRRGHHKRLRFGFCPVNDRIMNADQDWPEEAELSCDTICTRELFFPFIEKYYPDEFKWRNELNLMPFDNVRAMIREVRRVTRVMKRNWNDPRLRKYKRYIEIDLLVDSEEYEEKYMQASDAVRKRAVEEHSQVVTDFYTRLCDWLEKTMDEYEPEGYKYMAIFAPH